MADPDPFGAAIDRLEDRELLTGAARYTADLSRPGARHVALVRSPHAHARIAGIDPTAAVDRPGVHAVYTAADVEESGVPGTIPHHRSLPTAEDSSVPTRVVRPLVAPDHPLLAADVVRFAGEPVAAVLADDPYAARDAVAAVVVDYDRDGFVAVTDPAAALEAPEIHEAAAENVAFEWERGDAGATDRAFASAPNVASVELASRRLLPSPIEPRATLAEFDDRTAELTVWRSSQGVDRPRHDLSVVLGVDEADVRVRTPRVGGAFGTKSKSYPAELLAAWAAMRTDAPVSWVGTRTETSRTDAHGRAEAVEAELAYDDDGTLLGLRATSYADLGAYVFGRAHAMHTSSFSGGLPSQYAIPAIHCRVVGAFTTATPVGSYRATSRPQATLVVEQLVDRAAADLGLDPAELRRRNFVPPGSFPYSTPMGETYDSGAYDRALSLAMERADYEALRAEQAARGPDDPRLGIGVGCATDGAGGGSQTARLRVDPDESVTVDVTTLDSGQGHRTTFAQLLGSELGVAAADVALRQGDSSRRSGGSGTSASRSAVGMDDVLTECAREVVEAGREVAADRLEARPADLAFEDGDYFPRGARARSLSIGEAATLAGGALTATVSRGGGRTSPFATHLAVVEVDAADGTVALSRYVAVSDCGPQINPVVVEGQVHGSVAQGVGQVLLEGASYDGAGTLLNGSFQDYAMPRTTDLPEIETDSTVTPSPNTAHGVKGIGEVGTTAGVVAVTNAVVDALSPDPPRRVDLPFTDEAVWRAGR